MAHVSDGHYNRVSLTPRIRKLRVEAQFVRVNYNRDRLIKRNLGAKKDVGRKECTREVAEEEGSFLIIHEFLVFLSQISPSSFLRIRARFAPISICFFAHRSNVGDFYTL